MAPTCNLAGEHEAPAHLSPHLAHFSLAAASFSDIPTFSPVRGMQTASLAAWLQEYIHTPEPPCLPTNLCMLIDHFRMVVLPQAKPLLWLWSSACREILPCTGRFGSAWCRHRSCKTRSSSLQNRYCGGWGLCAWQDLRLVRVSQWMCPNLPLPGDSGWGKAFQFRKARFYWT